MYYRMIRNDMARSKVVTLTTMLFITAAAMLVSLAAILIIHLTGAIDTLMTQSKTPDFLQMHSGLVNEERLEAFAEETEAVEAYQLAEFLNVDNSRILFNGRLLQGNVQDNGFSVQNETFDYLLDLDGNRIDPLDGEVYVPISYRKEGIEVGDTALICGKEFVVAGFLRDSQMNSLLASSKRFLISPNDYEELKPFGTIEYLIEFRLKNREALSSFEAAYAQAGLEANGPTLTYPLFVTLNAVSDGLMIAVILLISVLTVAIAFLCIRFTLLAKIEDDYREIGVMKAIGLRLSDMKKIYLLNYAAMAAMGSGLGYVLSLVFQNRLIENIRQTLGESQYGYAAPVLGAMGVLLVFLVVTAYVNGVLNRFRKISPSEAIRFGNAQAKGKGLKGFRLSRNRRGNINVLLGVKDVLSRMGLYTTMLAIFILAVFIMLVPRNLYHTIDSPAFTSYMGIGQCSIRMDLQRSGYGSEGGLGERAEVIAKTMESDDEIDRYVVLTTKVFEVITDTGTRERLKMELGDHSVFPVNYTQGRGPKTDDELALSVLNADELSKRKGDSLTLIIDGKEKYFTICGIYSDITNGGKTAKAVFSDSSAEEIWCVICASLEDERNAVRKVSEYRALFTDVKVTGVDEFVSETFGATIAAVEKASVVASVVAILVTGLVTLLFMQMLVAKDRYSIAVMKATGFHNSDIRHQYLTRAILVLAAGVLLGIFLANTLGETLAGSVISSFGAEAFRFIVDPIFSYLFCPLVLFGTVILAALGGTARAGRIKISDHIKE